MNLFSYSFFLPQNLIDFLFLVGQEISIIKKAPPIKLALYSMGKSIRNSKSIKMSTPRPPKTTKVSKCTHRRKRQLTEIIIDHMILPTWLTSMTQEFGVLVRLGQLGLEKN